MFAKDDKELRFLVDHTFFHNGLRTNYDHGGHAQWLHLYVHDRYTFLKEKIIYMPRIIFDKILHEFPIYYNIPTGVVSALQKIIEITPTKPIKNDDDSAMLTVGHVLISRDICPIIISTVSREKWIGRIEKYGKEQCLEGFIKDKEMSEKRILNSFPCELMSFSKAKEILSKYDEVYKDVISFMKE